MYAETAPSALFAPRNCPYLCIYIRIANNSFIRRATESRPLFLSLLANSVITPIRLLITVSRRVAKRER